MELLHDMLMAASPEPLRADEARTGFRDITRSGIREYRLQFGVMGDQEVVIARFMLPLRGAIAQYTRIPDTGYEVDFYDYLVGRSLASIEVDKVNGIVSGVVPQTRDTELTPGRLLVIQNAFVGAIPIDHLLHNKHQIIGQVMAASSRLARLARS